MSSFCTRDDGRGVLVEGAVVLELKAVEQLTSLFNAKMISYLSITGHPLGLIINFNVPALRHGIKRIAGRPRRRDPTTPL